MKAVARSIKGLQRFGSQRSDSLFFSLPLEGYVYLLTNHDNPVAVEMGDNITQFVGYIVSQMVEDGIDFSLLPENVRTVLLSSIKRALLEKQYQYVSLPHLSEAVSVLEGPESPRLGPIVSAIANENRSDVATSVSSHMEKLAASGSPLEEDEVEFVFLALSRRKDSRVVRDVLSLFDRMGVMLTPSSHISILETMEKDPFMNQRFLRFISSMSIERGDDDRTVASTLASEVEGQSLQSVSDFEQEETNSLSLAARVMASLHGWLESDSSILDKLHVYSSFTTLYGKLGRIEEMEKFSRLFETTFNASSRVHQSKEMILQLAKSVSVARQIGYCLSSDHTKAMEIVEGGEKLSPPLISALICSAASSGNIEALELYNAYAARTFGRHQLTSAAVSLSISTYIDGQRVEAARTYLTKFVDHQELVSQNAYSQLIEALGETKRYQALAAVFQSDQNSMNLNQLKCDTLLSLYSKQGNFELVEALYETMVNREIPASLFFLQNLKQVYASLGKTQELAVIESKVVSLNFENQRRMKERHSSEKIGIVAGLSPVSDSDAEQDVSKLYTSGTVETSSLTFVNDQATHATNIQYREALNFLRTCDKEFKEDTRWIFSLIRAETTCIDLLYYKSG